MFFKRSQLIRSSTVVVVSLVAIWSLVVIIFVVSIAGVVLRQNSADVSVEYGAQALLVSCTALWAATLFVISILLFSRIRSFYRESGEKRVLLVKLFIGTFLGAVLSLTYAVYIFVIQLLSPINIFTQSNPLQAVTAQSWIAQSLNIALAGCMIWMIRPQHEHEEREVDTEATSKREMHSDANSTQMSYTMDIDD